VLHLAACARSWCRQPDEYDQVNLHAVETLVEAARRYQVQRLVHVSTVLTLVHPASRPLTHYERTKLAGERIAEQCEVATIVHPTRVYGPGPLNDANGATKVIAAYLAGRFRFCLDDHDVLANYVHVDDVAEGILLGRARCSACPLRAGRRMSRCVSRWERRPPVRRAALRVPLQPTALASATVAEAWVGSVAACRPRTGFVSSWRTSAWWATPARLATSLARRCRSG
jgi:hypothetical protein